MPRRTLTPATPAPTGPPVVLPHDLSQLAQSDPAWASDLQQLRRQWKWAAFSQFFYTFAPLLAMNDVTLQDIEDDLARGTMLYLPRVMQRLLYTLTQDRKITLDTWQTALRKQYMRRDPGANPLGPEPKEPSPEPSDHPADSGEEDAEGSVAEASGDVVRAQSSSDANAHHSELQHASQPASQNGDAQNEPKSAPAEETSVKQEDTVEIPQDEQEESRDWAELPMLVKLDSLHLLTEWQFQNPHRLRSIMKDDDEGAQWRIEPIGYDAKTNAYWLIGPDRLWIQRVPPRPPKGLKRKRPANNRSKARPSTSKVEEQEYESDVQTSPKRKRVQPQTPRRRPSRGKTTQASTPVVEQTPNGRSTRVAKLQANKKLDVQAKELAEFQRQAAALAHASKSNSWSTRQTRGHADSDASPDKSPNRPSFGTRASARLRGATSRDDDEWQQIPEEWLNENAATASEPRENKKSKSKGKAKDVDGEVDEKHPAEDLKTGLESDDAVSELTELSEDADGNSGQEGPPDEPVVQPKSEGSSGRRTRSSKRSAVAKRDISVDDAHQQEQGASDDQPAEQASQIPADFIEWETICVTLHEWEHIADQFEKASHYLEKALYKMLTQHIVPAVTVDLKEAERKHKIEEAIVHRKRSSRIAIKESEKEEARLAAKRKAEEQEKLARARRLEGRVKKEEVDREKREKAREQRRIEREERENRAREKQERAERRAKAEEDRGSTTTPAIAGTHSNDSVQLSSVTTPTGVQTPNWILDCEICHKHGLNLDDGLPMVSCGMCNKWQHISCHNHADQHAGRPLRNWDVQQFICYNCRSKHVNNGMSYNTPNHQRYPATPQYRSSSWSQSPVDPAMHMHKSSSFPRDLYPQSTSDIRFMPHQQTQNGMGYNQEAYGGSGPSVQPAYTRTQGGLTFSHYQPEQRAFTTTRTPLPQPVPAQQPGWAHGYPSAEASQGRPSQSVQFASQYGHRGGSYATGRMPTTYQQHTPPIPQHQPYGMTQEVAHPTPPSHWGSGTNGYFPQNDGVRSAAESLAYLQGAGSGQPHPQNGWHHSADPALPQASGGIHTDRNFPVPAFPGHNNSMGGAASYHFSS